MSAIAWLVVAGLAAAGAYFVGWPAWQASRERDARASNAERYLAWRGRAPRGSVTREGWTREERRRIIVAAALGVLAIVAVVAFFSVS